jgi:hypothetical protein
MQERPLEPQKQRERNMNTTKGKKRELTSREYGARLKAGYTTRERNKKRRTLEAINHANAQIAAGRSISWEQEMGGTLHRCEIIYLYLGEDPCGMIRMRVMHRISACDPFPIDWTLSDEDKIRVFGQEVKL